MYKKLGVFPENFTARKERFHQTQLPHHERKYVSTETIELFNDKVSRDVKINVYDVENIIMSPLVISAGRVNS